MDTDFEQRKRVRRGLEGDGPACQFALDSYDLARIRGGSPLGMAMRKREMRFHVGYARIYKANKRNIADADAMRMMRIAKNCRMAIPN